MYAKLFKNKWPLLAAVVLVVASTQYFVRNLPDEAVLTQPTAELAAPPVEPVDAAAEVTPEEPELSLQGFYGSPDVVSDGELIDSAQGFDPTPVEEESYDEETSLEEGPSGAEPMSDGQPEFANETYEE